MKPGIYTDLSNEDYHQSAGVGSSKLRVIQRTPAHLKGGERKESDAKEQGTLIHTAILEPERFEKTTATCDARRGTKAWKAAAEKAEEDNKTLYKSEPVEIALKVRDAVHRKPDISRLITLPDAMIEHSAYAVDFETSLLLKVRPDLVSIAENLMLDIKSTVSADPVKFGYSIGDYGYHFQAAMYLDVWQQARDQAPDEWLKARVSRFLFLALEKEPPFECALYEQDALSYDEGYLLYRKCAAKFAECQANDNWPGYPSGVVKLPLARRSFRVLDPDQLVGRLGFPIEQKDKNYAP